jgi:IS5 family transposase
VDRGKQGLKRSGMTDGYGIPLGMVLAGANHHDSPLLEATLTLLDDLVPLPDEITVHLDAGYDSEATRALLDARGLHGRIARKGEKAPVQANGRWHVERTHAWQNAFQRARGVRGGEPRGGRRLPRSGAGGRRDPAGGASRP